MSQESGRRLAVCPRLEVSHKVSVRLSVRATVSFEGWTAARGSTSRFRPATIGGPQKTPSKLTLVTVVDLSLCSLLE